MKNSNLKIFSLITSFVILSVLLLSPIYACSVNHWKNNTMICNLDSYSQNTGETITFNPLNNDIVNPSRKYFLSQVNDILIKYQPNQEIVISGQNGDLSIIVGKNYNQTFKYKSIKNITSRDVYRYKLSEIYGNKLSRTSCENKIEVNTKLENIQIEINYSNIGFIGNVFQNTGRSDLKLTNVIRGNYVPINENEPFIYKNVIQGPNNECEGVFTTFKIFSNGDVYMDGPLPNCGGDNLEFTYNDKFGNTANLLFIFWRWI